MRHCRNGLCPALPRDGVAAEYLDNVESCHECGDPLAPGAAPLPATPEPQYRELVTIYRASDATQAHLIRGALETEGISVYIKGESLRAAVGELPATVVQVEVQVSPDDATRAREIALQIEA